MTPQAEYRSTPELAGDPAASRLREFWRGARDTFPMLLGAAPVGMLFGALAVPSGLSSTAAILMSMIVFAGSSQFIALSLLAGGAGIAVIVLTTFVVNLRHALYSANLLPHVARLPQRWRIPLAFWLTDETFAVVQQRYADGDPSPRKHWYYLGSCLSMYSNWLFWTATGVLAGKAVAGVGGLGLEFAFAATFIGIVVPMLVNRPMVASAISAAAVALVARTLPYQLGLIVAALVGVAVGVLCENRRKDREQ